MNMTTKILVALLAAAFVTALSGPAAADAPALVPVSGVLTDASTGESVKGDLEITFALYDDGTGANELWAETQTVGFEEGFFSVYLGAQEALDLTVFRDNSDVFLGITVDGEEMDLLPLASAPFAAFAQHAGDAATLGGQGAEAFAAADHATAWDDLTGIPEELADGDADTLFGATDNGGLELDGTNFGLSLSCDEGQVLARTESGWGCTGQAAGDPEDELLLTVELDGTDLVITDAGGVYTVDLAGIRDGVDDADADPTNEIQDLTLSVNGSTLTIADGNSVDLSGLQDADADPNNEIQTLSVDGTSLSIGGGNTVDLSGIQDGVNDADADPNNEIQTLSVDGTSLSIGGGNTVDLSGIQDGVNDADSDPNNEIQDLTLALNGDSLTIADGNTVDLVSLRDDADADPTNEIQQLALEGSKVTIAGGNTVDLGMRIALNLGRKEADLVFVDDGNGAFVNPNLNDGGVLNNGAACDDCTQLVNMPFAVPYDETPVDINGTLVSEVFISSNGWIEFGSQRSSSDFSNECLPTDDHPDPFLAAFWDDLFADQVGFGHTGTAPNRVFWIYWDAQTLSGGANVDFSVSIHEGSGAIRVNYYDIADHERSRGLSATFGFQGIGAQNSRPYPISCNGQLLADGSDPGFNAQGWSISPAR